MGLGFGFGLGLGFGLELGLGVGRERGARSAAHEARTLRRESAARARREAGGLRSPHSAHLKCSGLEMHGRCIGLQLLTPEVAAWTRTPWGGSLGARD